VTLAREAQLTTSLSAAIVWEQSSTSVDGSTTTRASLSKLATSFAFMNKTVGLAGSTLTTEHKASQLPEPET
jgi:hypothetical protein